MKARGKNLMMVHIGTLHKKPAVFIHVKSFSLFSSITLEVLVCLVNTNIIIIIVVVLEILMRLSEKGICKLRVVVMMTLLGCWIHFLNKAMHAFLMLQRKRFTAEDQFWLILLCLIIIRPFFCLLFLNKPFIIV